MLPSVQSVLLLLSRHVSHVRQWSEWRVRPVRHSVQRHCLHLLFVEICYKYHFENPLWLFCLCLKLKVTFFVISFDHRETLLTCLLCSLYNLSIFNLKNLPDWPNSVFSLCSPPRLLPIKPQILCNNWNRKLKMVFMMWGPELFPFCVFVFPQHSENVFLDLKSICFLSDIKYQTFLAEERIKSREGTCSDIAILLSILNLPLPTFSPQQLFPGLKFNIKWDTDTRGASAS